VIRRLVVGIDGSANAADALAWSIDLAKAVGAEVVAVHAVGLRESAEARERGDGSPLAARFGSEWCAPLDDAGVEGQRLLLDGDPVSVLLRAAEDTGADLIVVGCRGVGNRPELLLGSTSSQVTQQSTIPVVVVPPRRPSS
jgi:nucleotide-binding universal stress UspA family protein